MKLHFHSVKNDGTDNLVSKQMSFDESKIETTFFDNNRARMFQSCALVTQMFSGTSNEIISVFSIASVE